MNESTLKLMEFYREVTAKINAMPLLKKMQIKIFGRKIIHNYKGVAITGYIFKYTMYTFKCQLVNPRFDNAK